MFGTTPHISRLTMILEATEIERDHDLTLDEARVLLSRAEIPALDERERDHQAMHLIQIARFLNYEIDKLTFLNGR